MKLGLIGLGKFGRNYVDTLSEYFPDVELVVACRRTNKRPDFLPASCKFETNYGKMLQSYKLDGVIAAMMPGQNLNLAAIAMERGIPVLIEKPACLSTNDFKYLTKAKSPLLVNYIHLFSQVFQKAKELIGNKKIISITSKGYNNGPIRDFSTLFDYAPHCLSMGLYLTKPKNVEVEYCQKHFNISNDQKALYNIKVNYDEITHTIEAGNYGEICDSGPPKKRTLEVKLENDETVFISNDFCLHFNEAQTIKAHYSFEHNMALVGTLNCFVNLINGGSDDRQDFDLTIKITKILEEVINSIG